MKTLKKVARSIITIIMTISMIVVNGVDIISATALATNSSNQSASGNTSSSDFSTPKQGLKQPRNLKTIKKDKNVNVSPDGEVVGIKQSQDDPFNGDELYTAFSSSASLKSGKDATDAKGNYDFAAIHDKYGYSKDDIDSANKLHGSMEKLSYELTAFDSSTKYAYVSDNAKKDILTLVKNGYTTNQAFAAYVASGVLNISISDLTKYRADEITAKQKDTTKPYQIINNINTNVENESQNTDYLNLSIKMGVPYSVIENCMKDGTKSCAELSDKFDVAQKKQYPPIKNPLESNKTTEAVTGSTHTGNVGYITNSVSKKPLLSSNGFTSFAPEKILEKPFSFETVGNLNVNINSGKYSYSETDLNIPGKNGLDLNITRLFDSDTASNAEPISYPNSTYANYPALKSGYIAYQWTGNDTYGNPILTTQPIDMSLYNLPENVESYYFTPYGLTQDTNGYNTTFLAYDYQSAAALKSSLGTFYCVLYPESGGANIIAAFIPQVIGISPYFNYAYYNQTIPNTYDVNDYGIGQGWTLGFSRIETYLAGFEGNTERKLITSDGRNYEISFGLNGSNLVGYNLTDIVLQNSGNGYTGASYTLVHKDGKKEYFDENGRNIAIVDRFGNAITLAYTYASSGAVSSITITDTVGHHIVYANENINSSQIYYAAGHQYEDSYSYNIAWSLTLDGQLIREYYIFAFSAYNIQLLRAVKNENSEFTVYIDSFTNCTFNSFVPSASSNDGSRTIVQLSCVMYPNGLYKQFLPNSIALPTEKLGNTGYQSYLNIGTMYDYYVDSNSNQIIKNQKTYTYGDYSALNAYVQSPTSTYSTTEQDWQLKNMSGGCTYAWPTSKTVYKFEYGNHHKDEEIVSKWPAIQTSQITSQAVFTSLASASTFVAGMTKDTTYSYDTHDLPTNIHAYFYNPGSSSASMSTGTQYSYDSYGNVLTQTKANGQSIVYTYENTYSIPTSETYNQNTSASPITILIQNTLTSDGKNIVTKTVSSNSTLQAKTEYGYDSYGNMVDEKDYSDANNYIEKQYVYGNNAQITEAKTLGVKDADNNLVTGSPGYGAGIVVQKETYNSRGWAMSETDANGNQTGIAYDTTGRVTSITNPDNSTETYVYDVANNKVTYTNENGFSVAYQYDPSGNLASTFDVAGNQILTSKTYDGINQLINETDSSSVIGNNKNIYYYYDSDDRLIEKGTKNSNGLLTSQETYSYTYTNGTFETTKTITGDSNSPSQVTTSYKDNMGNVVKAGGFLNGTEYDDITTYDYSNNKLSVLSAYTASINGTVTCSYTYDYAGHVLSTTDALSHVSNNTYNWLGNQITESDNVGNIMQYTYDALGRLLQKQQPFTTSGSTTSYAVTKNYYDNNGNIISKKVQSNAPGAAAATWDQTDYTYSNRNKLLMVTTFNNGSPVNYTQYYYDGAGNILRMYTGLSSPLTITGLDTVSGTDTTYSVTKYAYNRFSQLTAMIDPLSQTESYTNDINGNMLAKTDRNGGITTYTYDDLGRLTFSAVTTSDGTGDASLSMTYTMTGLKRSENNGTATVTYTYDALGRVAAESSGDVVKGYAFDIGNDRTGFTMSVGGVQQFNTSYTYDALNRMSTMTQGSVTAAYQYDANGNRQSVTYNNGLVESYLYNNANLVTTLTNKNSGNTVLSQYTYIYNLDGNQTNKTDQSGNSYNYTYDGLGRLTSEIDTINGLTQGYSYSFDDSNNRAGLIAAGLQAYSTSYAYDLNNRLQTAAKSAGSTDTTTTYFYDPNGNQISSKDESVISGSGTVGYTLTNGVAGAELNRYNGFNQLVESNNNGADVSYTYYPSGLRASKASGGVTTSYLLDGDQDILEMQSGAVTAKYIRAINLVSSTIGTTTNYYLFNAHGDVTQLANASGTVTKNYDYDAFGNEQNPDTSDTNPFRYCGEYLDLETNTYYLRARNYDPTTGHFLSEDTYWNTKNMIYGDKPVKINEGKGDSLKLIIPSSSALKVNSEKIDQTQKDDPLGLNTYTYVPDINAIAQSGNLYAFCNNNPVNNIDPSGHGAESILVGMDVLGSYMNYCVFSSGDYYTGVYNGYDIRIRIEGPHDDWGPGAAYSPLHNTYHFHIDFKGVGQGKRQFIAVYGGFLI
jgi:RHS repeat-associated protein